MQGHSDWAAALPAAPLRAFIDRYVGYRLSGFPPGAHRGLPSRHLTFIVSVGPAIDVIRQTDPHQDPASYRCVVSGLQDRSATISYGAHQEGVAIELSPLGARALFGMPSGVLWDTSLECVDVVGGRGWELWERLQGVPEWSGRFAVCDDVLLRWADTEVRMPPSCATRGARWCDRGAPRRSASSPRRWAGAGSTWPGGSGTSSVSARSWPRAS